MEMLTSRILLLKELIEIQWEFPLDSLEILRNSVRIVKVYVCFHYLNSCILFDLFVKNSQILFLNKQSWT